MNLRTKQHLFGIAGILALIIAIATFAAIAYLATEGLYQKFAWQPIPLLRQIITSVLGMILFILAIGALRMLFLSKHLAQQMAVLAPFLTTLDAIARGNFDVRIESRFMGREEELLGELASGVNSMAQRLKAVEAMRQEFISDVSHEIQSPLTSIRGFAQALRDEQLSNETHTHYLDVIENESLRLSKLSENLLALATLNSPHMQLAPKGYRLDKQIRRLVLSCEPQWAAKAIDVELALAELTISADEELLSRVWLNLLHNSIKFTPQGGRIALTLKQSDQQIEFCIQDSGIGIAEEDQARLFERFFKADRARNQAMGGSGLGLAIVKKIVEMHEGTIQVVSQRDVGTTFTVTLSNPPSQRL